MHAGSAGGCDNCVGTALIIESRNVVSHGPAEQLDILRQITDMAAQLVWRPLVDICSVQSDTSG